jgi:hypothetical protein
MKLWTVWTDYSATGEGRTLLARIAYADSEQSALSGFAEVFGEFHTRGADAKQGVVGNPVTELLFSPQMFREALRLEGRANVDLFAKFHFNFS